MDATLSPVAFNIVAGASMIVAIAAMTGNRPMILHPLVVLVASLFHRLRKSLTQVIKKRKLNQKLPIKGQPGIKNLNHLQIQGNGN